MTSTYPCSPSSAATSEAPFSCVSRTSAPPGRRAVARVAYQSVGLTAVDERDVGLPVDDVPRQGRDLVGADVRRVRDDEVPAFTGEPREEIVAPELDRRRPCAPRSRGRARARPPTRRCRSRARPGCSSAIASAIAPDPVPTSSTLGASAPSSSARQRSTTVSVSGRGMSARRSTASVSRRKPHSPRTYWSGSPDALRVTSARAAVELVSGQGTVEVHVELDPVDSEDVPQQALGIEPRPLGPLRRRDARPSDAARRRS